MNLRQACRPYRGSCSPIPGRGCFGDLPGDNVGVSPPSPIVEPLDLSSPVKMPSIRSAVELSNEDPVSDALRREKFRSAGGENSSFHAAPRNFLNLGRVEFPASPVITREKQAAREMQEHAISPAAAQDKTAAASARLAQAFPHVHVT